MTSASSLPAPTVWRQYYALTKPRVVQLIVFCALIGMVLAVPGVPSTEQLLRAALACLGAMGGGGSRSRSGGEAGSPLRVVNG